MDRLTNRGGVRLFRFGPDEIEAIYKRLAEYEDTGLTPQEFDDLCRTMSAARTRLGIMTFDELIKALDGGAIIRLPCGINDPVYIIETKYTGKKKTAEYVERAEIDCFRIGESGVPVADICTDDGSWYEAMEPKDYYTSKEDAEKALEAKKGQAGNG